MELFIIDLISKYPIAPLVLSILGLIVVLAQVIVLMTPGKKDDAIMEKIEANPFGKKLLSFFVSFAPIQKSAKKGLELSNTSLNK